MRAIDELKKNLQRGHLYRRKDLEEYSNAIDRHLEQLLVQKELKKISGRIYYYPKKSKYGDLPPNEMDLIKTFLNDSNFLIVSPNDYNSLGVGSTQLYNEVYVYNHKRHGRFKLGHRNYNFIRRPYFPKKVTEEFLLVDLLNNSKTLLDNKEKLLEAIPKRLKKMNASEMRKITLKYGGVSTKNLILPLIHL